MSKISVIVPIYRVEKYLNQCIESVVNQTYKNLEIILVDDGSPDNCPKMCDDWAKKDKRIKVIHKKNAGVSQAVIDGIKNATGEYFAFLDSDDYVSPNFIEKIYTNMKETGADIGVCNYIEVYDSREEKVDTIKENIVIEKGKDIENCVCTYAGWNGFYIAPCRWNKIFNRELICESLEYVNREIFMGEDLNMTFYAMAKANKVVFINDYLHYYRQITTSLSKTKRNNWNNYKGVIEQLFVINEKEKLNLEELIYKNYIQAYIKESVNYAVENYKRKEFKEFLSDEYLQKYAKAMPTNKLKMKIYYWGIRHKNIFLIKLAIRINSIILHFKKRSKSHKKLKKA